MVFNATFNNIFSYIVAVLVLYNLDKNNPINKKLSLPTYPLLLFKKVSRKTGILFFGLN
jgi:hypothetical protein